MFGCCGCVNKKSSKDFSKKNSTTTECDKDADEINKNNFDNDENDRDRSKNLNDEKNANTVNNAVAAPTVDGINKLVNTAGSDVNDSKQTGLIDDDATTNNKSDTCDNKAGKFFEFTNNISWYFLHLMFRARHVKII